MAFFFSREKWNYSESAIPFSCKWTCSEQSCYCYADFLVLREESAQFQPKQRYKAVAYKRAALVNGFQGVWMMVVGWGGVWGGLGGVTGSILPTLHPIIFNRPNCSSERLLKKRADFRTMCTTVWFQMAEILSMRSVHSDLLFPDSSAYYTKGHLLKLAFSTQKKRTTWKCDLNICGFFFVIEQDFLCAILVEARQLCLNGRTRNHRFNQKKKKHLPVSRSV